ncbi:hypothetical protein HDC33_002935 [Sporosarcina sp. JAI121]|nr:hypothetical protein [Sporosarcina sp. JAI121]
MEVTGIHAIVRVRTNMFVGVPVLEVLQEKLK